MRFVWTKGQGLPACYLLASTVLLMIVVFTLEDIVFPGKLCSSCNSKTQDGIALLVGIDQTGPLLQRRAEGDAKVDEHGTSISEAKRNVEVSEVDLSNAHRTDRDRKLPNANARDVNTARKPTDDGGGEKNGSFSLAPLPPQVRSVKFYTTVYEHPVPELRSLTVKDGTPPLRSNIPPLEREITIVTQVKQMHTRMENQSRCRLDIQLVTEDGYETDEEALQALYPVNALRNVALGMAKTKLIFLLDADFKPSPRLHESLTEDEETYEALLRKAREDNKLFVVPAFEAASVKGGRSPILTVPETMEELRKGWEDKRIDCFHCRQAPAGHTPTNFETFFDPATTTPYPITYKNGFEPYVIGALDIIPPYDGRFRGYGENKISHLYACAADGMGFLVLPNVFVFELPHPHSEARETFMGKHRDPDHRNRIRGLASQFRKEIEKKQMEKDPVKYRQFIQLSRE